ncbi:unnamed protein product [Notodromas monacha]|uniref:C2H2-type domain-containing protein n=1 Tax=Notodromas monacha TaxID=399045 RepID=A0A7R9GI32_9CRUS|nr:unnamed protein product [Notodromas monacha]CAG0923530.1 unnamed protein product [Notodromas monacha]
MEALLQFMYTGQTSICQNKLAVLLQAAAALQIKGLAEVSGLSYDDLERGDVGTTETATCTQQVVGEARNTGRKPVPLKNDTTRRDGSSEPTTKKRKQLPVLQAITTNEQKPMHGNGISADLTPEPKDYSVSTRAYESDRAENCDGDELSSIRDLAAKENIDSNIPSVKSEALDDYDDDMEEEEGRIMFPNGYETNVRSPGGTFQYHGISTGGKSPLLPLDPSTLSSGDSSLSAAAKLQEVASRVCSGSAGLGEGQGGRSIGVLSAALKSESSSDDSNTPRKLAFHEPRPCPVCKRIYRDAATLRTHTAIMHTEGTTPFFCSCGSPFRTKYEMYVHKKNGHRPNSGNEGDTNGTQGNFDSPIFAAN